MKRGCLFAVVAVLLAATGGLGFYFYNQSNKDPEVYEVEKPQLSDILKKTVATGSIKPRQEIMIKPQVSGVVEERFVEEGMMVKKGQQIARIKLVPSEVNINSAQSSVELARLRLQEAERELARQRTVNTQQLDVEAARVNFENAKLEEDRQRRLLDEGVISQQEYNRFKVDLEIRKAELENARLISGNSLKQFETNVEVARQELNAAINNLQLLREGRTRNSNQVANIVTSTVDGMILDLPVEEGASVIERNNFNEGTSIAIIADMNNLIFEGKVDEADVGKLREGMPLKLTVGAIEGKVFDAILEFISPKGVEEEGVVKFEVRAAIQQPTDGTFLRAGYSANGDIILDRRVKVLSVKERDVLYEKDTTYVEIKTGDQQFEKKIVQLGLSDGLQVELLGGVDSTAQVKVQKK